MHIVNKTLLLAATALAPALFSTASIAQEAGDWMIRGRALLIAPDESSETSIGGEVDVSTEVTPEVDVTYFVTSNFAIEVIAGTAEHQLTAVGTAIGDVDIGSTWVVPATISAQYHFRANETVKPYVGAGINYTLFLDGEEGAVDNISLSDEFGFALQAGVDVDINEKWLVNFDVKRIWVGTDASINGGAITGDVDVDPWVFALGIGYKF